MLGALACHQCGPGSISTRYHTRVELPLRSHLASLVRSQGNFYRCFCLEFKVRSSRGNHNYRL